MSVRKKNNFRAIQKDASGTAGSMFPFCSLLNFLFWLYNMPVYFLFIVVFKHLNNTAI